MGNAEVLLTRKFYTETGQVKASKNEWVPCVLFYNFVKTAETLELWPSVESGMPIHEIPMKKLISFQVCDRKSEMNPKRNCSVLLIHYGERGIAKKSISFGIKSGVLRKNDPTNDQRAKLVNFLRNYMETCQIKGVR